MAATKPEPPLEVPADVARLLDAYAEKLGAEFLFPVNRQQAFERFVRVMMTKEA